MAVFHFCFMTKKISANLAIRFLILCTYGSVMKVCIKVLNFSFTLKKKSYEKGEETFSNLKANRQIFMLMLELTSFKP